MLGEGIGVKEVGVKNKQQEVEGALRAPKHPTVWSLAKPQPMRLGSPGDLGEGWVLALRGRTSLLLSVPAESVSPALRVCPQRASLSRCAMGATSSKHSGSAEVQRTTALPRLKLGKW